MKFFAKIRSVRILYGLLAGLLLAGIGTWGQVQGTAKDTISEAGLHELYNTVLYHVRNDYVDEVPSKTLWFGAIRGLLSSLDDPHTRFMTPDEYNELQVETRGNFGGLGIEISMRDNVLTVVSPIEGTPAMRAGLQPGDKIVEIEKKTTHDMSLTEAVKILRGTPGTSVNLAIARDGEDEIMHFDIVREVIKIQVVNSEYLEKYNLGYIKLKQFSQTAGNDIAEVLKDFKNKKVKGVILDLRWDPGGLLDAATRVANLFIKEGVIVSTRGRHPELDKVFSANAASCIMPDTPLVVLANEGSASASEIVTGAIKDHKRGLFIGSKTFGKGSVQSVIPLMHNTAIALTIQKYYTPSGVSIHKKGIEPDIEVKPLDFTKEDRRHYRELSEKKIIQEFVAQHPDNGPEAVATFEKLIDSKGLSLSGYALRFALKQEYGKNKKQPLIDLEFDNQLQKAIEVLTKK